jgi:DNA repair ATPase RecN
MNLQQLEFIVTKMKDDYTRGFGAREALEKELREATNELAQANDDIDNWELEKLLCAEAAEHARAQTITHIEQIVTAGLQTVFTEEDSQFKIDIRTISDVPAAYWLITDDSGEHRVENVPEEDGGGAVDVVSVSLRTALIQLFNCTGPVLFDEVGKHVDAKQIKNFAFFIKEYAEKTGRQVVYVTHQTAIADVAHKAYEIVKKKGISEAVMVQ